MKVTSGSLASRQSWEPAPVLLSAGIAYASSYLLLEQFTLGLPAASVELISRRDIWLFGGTFLLWLILLGTAQARSSEDPNWLFAARQFWASIAFWAILGSLYAMHIVPATIFTSLVVASLLYIPISCLMLYLTFHIRRAGHLIQHDSHILLIGSKARAQDAIVAIHEAGEEYKIVACLDPDSTRHGACVANLRVTGTTEHLTQYLFGHAVDLMVFALPLELVPNASGIISKAMEIGVPVSVVLESGLHRVAYRPNKENHSYKEFASLPTVVLSNVPGDCSYLVVKRIVDITVSAFALVVLSPLFLLVALLIKITSPNGPIFYRWKVLGRNRKPFVGYKFRTMVPNAEQLKSQLMQHNEMQGPAFKMQSDPRVTPLGRILRKYSIDELPQLYSVLKGDMSLVGPRPPAKEEADRFEFWQRRKLSVKPGITCLWQVNGRSDIKSFDEWARLDLEYIEGASLFSDLKILLRTIPAVMRGTGAH